MLDFTFYIGTGSTPTFYISTIQQTTVRHIAIGIVIDKVVDGKAPATTMEPVYCRRQEIHYTI